MTYEILKWLHLTAIVLLILSLGGAAFHMMNGGTKDFGLRKRIGMLSGISLMVILVTGPLLANHIYSGVAWQYWVYLKFVLWLYLGMSLALLYRKPKSASLIFWSIFLTASFATFLAVWKPF